MKDTGGAYPDNPNPDTDPDPDPDPDTDPGTNPLETSTKPLPSFMTRYPSSTTPTATGTGPGGERTDTDTGGVSHSIAVVLSTRAGVRAEVTAGTRERAGARVEERVEKGVCDCPCPKTQKAEPLLTNPTPRMSTGVPPVDDPLWGDKGEGSEGGVREGGEGSEGEYRGGGEGGNRGGGRGRGERWGEMEVREKTEDRERLSD